MWEISAATACRAISSLGIETVLTAGMRYCIFIWFWVEKLSSSMSCGIRMPYLCKVYSTPGTIVSLSHSTILGILVWAHRLSAAVAPPSGVLGAVKTHSCGTWMPSCLQAKIKASVRRLVAR